MTLTSSAPKIDYLSRDFEGLKESLLTYAANVFPDWQPASEGDFGMMLVELFSYLGDIMSYYTDRAQLENYLSTATQRESVLAIAYILGYVPSPGTPAQGTVSLTTDSASVLVPAGTQIMSKRIDALDSPVTFETNADATILKATPQDVPVTEGQTELYLKIGESTGLPNQSFLLPDPGVYTDTLRLFVEDYSGSTTITLGTKTIQVREWLPIDHLLDAEYADTVFESTQSASNTTTVLLGDDINGAIPPTGLQIFATYRHGFGLSGNVAAGQVYLINSRSLRGVRVDQDPDTGMYQSSEMVGGADPESTDSIRYNAPRAYRTQSRAINEQDFLDLALGVTGVTKANVVTGSFTSITVYITGPDGGAPTNSLKDLVATRFQDNLLIGVSVTVAAPDFIAINFGTVDTPVLLELRDQYSQANVKAAVIAAITTMILNMPFGRKMTVGAVYDAISTVEGVEFAHIPVMARADSDQTGTENITPRVWEVFTAGEFNIAVTGGVA